MRFQSSYEGILNTKWMSRSNWGGGTGCGAKCEGLRKLPILIWPVRPTRKYFQYLFLRSTYVYRLNIPKKGINLVSSFLSSEPAASHHLDKSTQNPSHQLPLIVMNYSAIHGHMEYYEPMTCSLHQFLTGSSNLKAAAAGDCCVAIEFA